MLSVPSLDVNDARTGARVMNLSSPSSAEFLVTGLRPSHGYVVRVTALNRKGGSEPVTLHTFTMAETAPEQIVADTSRQPGLGTRY